MLITMIIWLSTIYDLQKYMHDCYNKNTNSKLDICDEDEFIF